MPLEPAPSLGAVLLAAGASRRLGRPKQLIEVAGQPLVVRAVEALLASPGVWPVVVVLGAEAAQIRPLLARHPVLLADNAAWAEGMAASLRLGITTLQTFSRHLSGGLVALCDQPAFSATAVARLLEARAATGADLVAARYEGHPGAPAIFSRKHFPALGRLVGDEGARRLLSAAPAGSLVEVDLPELGTDFDTPGDLARWHEGQGA